MNTSAVSGGVAHELPADLKKALTSNKAVLDKWEGLTPLARNEWICWSITVKQAETRRIHTERTVKELLEGKRRPCCWVGCVHRTDKAISPTQKWVLNRQIKILNKNEAP